MELLEKQQLEALKAGDETAFEMMFRSWYQELCNYAYTFVRDREEAEEVVQGSFVNFWEKRQTLHIATSMRAYLFSMVRNASLNRLKHEKVRQRHAAMHLRVADPSVESVTHQVQATELQDRISSALEALPEQCRLIFKMNRFEDMKYAEIANALNISVKTVENQIGKALKLMREKLSDYLPFVLIFIHLLN